MQQSIEFRRRQILHDRVDDDDVQGVGRQRTDPSPVGNADDRMIGEAAGQPSTDGCGVLAQPQPRAAISYPGGIESLATTIVEHVHARFGQEGQDIVGDPGKVQTTMALVDEDPIGPIPKGEPFCHGYGVPPELLRPLCVSPCCASEWLTNPVRSPAHDSVSPWRFALVIRWPSEGCGQKNCSRPITKSASSASETTCSHGGK